MWITGVGVLCALGNEREAILRSVDGEGATLKHIDVAGRRVGTHPVAPFDTVAAIPDRRSRELLSQVMQYGVIAAEHALASAASERGARQEIALCVAASNGERSDETDRRVIGEAHGSEDPDAVVNKVLARALRPTSFLGRLPNMLAANISTMLGVEGASRSFIGGAAAGFHAVKTGYDLIAHGRYEVVLVGGAFNPDSVDALLQHVLTAEENQLASGSSHPGGAAAFLVIASDNYAPSDRRVGELSDVRVFGEQVASGSCVDAEGSCRVELVIEKEAVESLGAVAATGLLPMRSAYRIDAIAGDCREAAFPLGVAIGALCLGRGGPMQAEVTARHQDGACATAGISSAPAKLKEF